MRKRMLNPEFFTDSDIIANFDFAGRLFYEGLWCVADDSGCLSLDALSLKMKIFPGDNIDISTIQKYVDTLIAIDKIIPYEVDGKQYGWIKNFCKHQRLDRPSPPTIPLPPFIIWHDEEKEKYKWYYEVQYGSTSSRRAVVEQSSSKTPLIEKNRIEKNRIEVNSKEDSLDEVNGKVDTDPAIATKNIHSSSHDIAIKTTTALVAEKPNPNSDNNMPMATKEATEEPPYNKIMELYNAICPPALPKITTITTERRLEINARWREHPDIKIFKQVFTEAANSDYICGRTKHKFRCSFDWLIKEESFTKTLEGAYRQTYNNQNSSNYNAGQEVSPPYYKPFESAAERQVVTQ